MVQETFRPGINFDLPNQTEPPTSVIILDLWPQIDCGRYPIKRETGDTVVVWADIFKDGHDKIAACIEHRRAGSDNARRSDMILFDNDRWTGSFHAEEPGRYEYRVVGYPDLLATKRDEITKKFDAGIDIELELREYDSLLERVQTTHGDSWATVNSVRGSLAQRMDQAGKVAVLASIDTIEALRPYRELAGSNATKWYPLMVDRLAARFAAWYELFPRSSGTIPGQSATFRDVEDRLADISGMGFDVLYFTPVHPIGAANKKGKNNSLVSGPDDPGSPYAIGSPAGGHDAVDPALGTIEDFDHLVAEARGHGLEIALDIAFQASPDHPWATAHPDWFTVRPDGTIKYAENPPKKYEDIYPINFDSEDWKELWLELLRVVQFWVEHGVKTFRVDNPHTKPIVFWEWLIGVVHRNDPDVIFLSEAFTRPKVMKALAKAGFAQSYTYFTWRTERWEIEQYFNELTGPEVSQYMRGNLFPNTHDINPFHLQQGGPPMFKARMVMAATLSSVYGIYSGFELCEATPVPGKEEYLNSEKYEYKVWDWDRPGNIKDLIRTVNKARRDHPALQEYDNLHFFSADDQRVLTYAKTTSSDNDRIVCIISLDPLSVVSTWIHLDLGVLGIDEAEPFAVTELISGSSWTWTGAHQQVEIDPAVGPAWILSLTDIAQ